MYNNLLKIEHITDRFKISGYVSNNTFYRGNRKHQYLYVNKRYVNNKDISNLIENKYKSLIPINRYPIFILFIDIDPSLIDVNIHPTKQEVKFMNHQEILDALDSTLSRILTKNLYIQKVAFSHQQPKDQKDSLPHLYEENAINKDHNNSNLYNLPRIDRKINKENTIIEDHSLKGFLAFDNENIEFEEKELVKEEVAYEDKDNIKDDRFLQNVKIIGVLFSTYILMEDLTSSKLLIMDQHAAHERIMYEKYKREYEAENVAIQTLLTPEVIELTSTELEFVIENIDLLKNLGFIVEEFGQKSIVIRGVPILFGKPQVKTFFLELIDSLKSNINSSYEIKIDKIMKIACTNAIKSGDKITDLEIQSLIAQLKNSKNPYTCPHGRPTVIEISKKDIEKEFKRIM